MRFRSVRIAYAIPPLVAVVLGVLGLLRVDQDGVIGVEGVVTVSVRAAGAPNAAVAEALTTTARDHGVTVVRVVADRSAPTSRRILLVTDEPDSVGAAWLRSGYPAFARSVQTRVESMSQLVRFDPIGTYGVVGDGAATTAVAAAVQRLGYRAVIERIPVTDQYGLGGGLGATPTLLGAVVLACAALCLVGTLGAPRRTAVQRLNGQRLGSVLVRDLGETRWIGATLVCVAPVTAVLLWSYNGLAAWWELTVAVSACTIVLSAPVVLVHCCGVLGAHGPAIGPSLRGARPPSLFFPATVVGRGIAVVLLVSACFDLVGAQAVVRSGDAVRDLRAAGKAVALWITPDPRPGAQTEQYWQAIGAFTAEALSVDRAVLAATTEISAGPSRGTTPALLVDRSYLLLQDVRDAQGRRITGEDDRISVWFPPSEDLDRTGVVTGLEEWELRAAPQAARQDVWTGVQSGRSLYSYPGDDSVAPWLDDAVLVVVPDAEHVFSTDQLGSWLSTGDVVFEDRGAAERALADSAVAGEVSAVVDVGQDAAERSRRATTAVRLDAMAVSSAAIVLLLLGVVGIATHRRRHGRLRFVRATAGWSSIRADLGLLVAEGVVLAVGGLAVLDEWWDRRPDGTGAVSALDPAARSASSGAFVASAAVAALAAMAVVLVLRSGRSVVAARGKGS